MTDGTDGDEFILKEMLLVHLELRFGQKYLPCVAVMPYVISGFELCSFKRHAVRIVAFEMCGVDFDRFDGSGISERENDPVITWPASPGRFPAIPPATAGWYRQRRKARRSIQALVVGAQPSGATNSVASSMLKYLAVFR